MTHLHDKVVVITGASSGIGAATAKLLAAKGARIVAAAIDQDQLDRVVGGINNGGGTAVGRFADVTDPAQVKQLVDQAMSTFGSVDVLVNNAGLMLFSYWKDLATADWQKMVDVNIRGYLNTIGAVLPIMLEQGSGHIVNLSSVAGHEVAEAAGVYCATKFFVRAITNSLRIELGVHEGIRASMISPGVIDTGWNKKVNDPRGREVAAEVAKVAISPERVADAIRYILDQPADTTINDLIVHPTRQPW
jgi:NADP-dependent 3-hydroxy acid dehydrogenase YdfG